MKVIVILLILFAVSVVGFLSIIFLILGPQRGMIIQTGGSSGQIVPIGFALIVCILALIHIRYFKSRKIQAVWGAIMLAALAGIPLTFINSTAASLLDAGLFFIAIFLGYYYSGSCPNCGSRNVSRSGNTCTYQKCGKEFENRIASA